ncbi:pentapeptide repeat-containing protein, partial [Candidatus Saccharibacteria bacterium]|nr:pentapeptide repeat-containing protein [Candidatus Saccharibacteria bacterium]
MKKLSKEEALAKIEELKQYVDEVDTKVEKSIGITIKSRWAESTIVYQSTKTTIKEAVEEAVSSDANLSDAYLRGADLRGADLRGADLRG